MYQWIWFVMVVVHLFGGIALSGAELADPRWMPMAIYNIILSTYSVVHFWKMPRDEKGDIAFVVHVSLWFNAVIWMYQSLQVIS